MKKKIEIVMLPTNQKAKENDIILLKEKRNISSVEEGKLALCIFPNSNDLGNVWETHHLYFLSNEEIKEGDWVYRPNYHEKIGRYLVNDNLDNGLYGNDKKIIATTDKSLTINIDGNRGNLLPDVSFDIELPQPSQEFIQYYIDEYNNGNIIKFVNVEYEITPMGRVAIEYGATENGVSSLKVNPDNTINISPIKETWSRDEVVKLMKKSIDKGMQHVLHQQLENHIYSVLLKKDYKVIHKKPHIDKWISENLK